MTSALGTAVAPNNTILVSGLEFETRQGQIVGEGSATGQPTGQSATVSVGSLTVEEGLGLTGQSFNASVGSIAVSDVVGLTGFSMTSSLGRVTTIPIYGDIDTGSNTSYTDLATGSNTSYSDAA